MKQTDVRVRAAAAFLIPLETRSPMRFGGETLKSITVLRACLTVEDRRGRTAVGWGETPLSVEWAWPATIDHATRRDVLLRFCRRLVDAWSSHREYGHPIETGLAFHQDVLPAALAEANEQLTGRNPIPQLAAIVCSSAFDLALHDAYGQVHSRPTYSTYTAEFMNRDLSSLMGPSTATTNAYPMDFLKARRPTTITSWHLVAAEDPLDETQLTGEEPKDGYPTHLRDWIRADGLRALKVKLRGVDFDWDCARLIQVGKLASEEGVRHLAADFNCMVKEVGYVLAVLDRLEADAPEAARMLQFVEQPFGRDLEAEGIDVRTIAERVPVLLDESAHDWRAVEQGRLLGWTGTALKTCKGQTGALLMLAWSRIRKMHVMVQDLTNPMLAQVSHALLAAHGASDWGVETNSMQFYPEASRPEQAIHPGLYRRRNGLIDLSSIAGPGFGYRADEISRVLPPASFRSEAA